MPRGTERIRRSRSSLRLRAHTAGGRSDLGERTPRRSPAGPRTCRAGSGLQFLLSNWVAATSKWGHRPASGDLWIISLPGVSFVDGWGGGERGVGPLVRPGSRPRHGQGGRRPAATPVRGVRRSIRAVTARVHPVTAKSSERAKPSERRGGEAAAGAGWKGSACFVTAGRLGRCQCCGVAWGHE